MTRSLFLHSFAVAALVCSAQQPGTPEAVQTISGIVINEVTARPLSGTTVVMSVEQGESTQSAPASSGAALSGQDGRFTIPNISRAAKQLRIYCQQSGFVTFNRVISLETEKNPIEIRMTPQAVITGHVTDSAGSPLTGASVRLNRTRVDGRRTALTAVGQATTDDQGHYRIYGLEPGRYYISSSYQDPAAALGLRKRSATADDPSKLVTEDYAVVYYPAAADPESATPVILKAGKVTTNIDMRIGMAQSYSVSGTVFGFAENGPPPEVFLQPLDPASLGPSRISIPLPGTSQFHFQSIPPGNYTLTASASYNGVNYRARQEISVGAPVSGISLQLQAPFAIAGVTSMEDGSPVPKGIEVRLSGLDSPQQANLALDELGNFQGSTLSPDSYRVTVSDPKGSLYLKTLSVGDRTVPNSIAAIAGPNQQLRLVLSAKAGGIRGSTDASAARNRRTAGLAVLVGEQGEPYIEPLDPQGRFKVTALPPGKYRLACFADLSSPSDVSWDVQRKVTSSGKAVTVKEGETIEVAVDVTAFDAGS